MRWFALMLLALLVAVPATGQVFRDDQILMSSGNRLDADVASGTSASTAAGREGGTSSKTKALRCRSSPISTSPALG